MPRAVITGTSLISPAGADADEAFGAWLTKRCAGQDAGLAAPLDRVPLARLADGVLAADPRWSEPTAALAVAAARAALREAGLDAAHMRRPQSAIVAATSKGGVLTALADHAGRLGLAAQAAAGELWQWGTPACALSALSEYYRPGGAVTNVVAACASGLAAVAHGARLIAAGEADTVLVVAADASIHPLFVGSFWRMGVLAAWRERPGDACRPFAADRCGFVLSEGAGAVVLQALHAVSRNRDSCPAVVSWAGGAAADNLVGGETPADAQAVVLRTALGRAGWSADGVGMVHAHATGTVHGDRAEAQAVRHALGQAADHTPVLASKPITGHMLGAAGLAQLVLTAKALQAGIAPPTANHASPDPQCRIDCNPSAARPLRIGRALCLASGFGGAIAAVALERRE